MYNQFAGYYYLFNRYATKHKEDAMSGSKLSTYTDAGVSRRSFLKGITVSGAALMLGNGCGLFSVARVGDKKNVMILVDYSKCTGCRTCETVCSAHNHRVSVNNESLNGLGNPYLSNIKVYPFNPDVDVARVCAMCPDNPCIEACPVDPDPKTGRRALYRHETTGAITNDPDRCIGYGSCAEACRVGVITPNNETNMPERMCTLCGGDPQCVKLCPFGALTQVTVDTSQDLYAMKPEQVAETLTKRWYPLNNQ